MRYTKGPRVKKRPQRPAIETAFWYLGRRERTQKELKDKLIFRGYSEEEVDEAIKKLKKLDYLDDFKFAQNFIHSSLIGRAKGKRRVGLELKRKGVDQDIIEKAFEQGWPDDEGEIIAKEAKRAVKKNISLPREKIYQRSVSYLMRRGFSYDKAKKAVLENLDEEALV